MYATIIQIEIERQINHLANSNGVTNAGVANMTKNLADQVASDQILVNCIHPGSTRTPRQVQILERRARDLGTSVEEAERQVAQSIPIGRLVEPDDIAHLIRFGCNSHIDVKLLPGGHLTQ